MKLYFSCHACRILPWKSLIYLQTIRCMRIIYSIFQAQKFILCSMKYINLFLVCVLCSNTSGPAELCRHLTICSSPWGMKITHYKWKWCFTWNLSSGSWWTATTYQLPFQLWLASLECNYSTAQNPVGSAVKASSGGAYLYSYEVSLCWMKQCAMKTFWGVKLWLMHAQSQH